MTDHGLGQPGEGSKRKDAGMSLCGNWREGQDARMLVGWDQGKRGIASSSLPTSCLECLKASKKTWVAGGQIWPRAQTSLPSLKGTGVGGDLGEFTSAFKVGEAEGENESRPARWLSG